MRSSVGKCIQAAFFCATGFLSQLAAADTQSFSVPGTYSWTVPAGITSVTLSATGGGGGGGTGIGAGSVAGHGGNGGVSSAVVPAIPGDIWTVVVGAGGGLGQGGTATSVALIRTILMIAGGGGGGGTSGSNDPVNGGDGAGGWGGSAISGGFGGSGGSAGVGGAGGSVPQANYLGLSNSASGSPGNTAVGIAVVPGGAGGIGTGYNGTGYSGGSGGSGYGGGGGGSSGGVMPLQGNPLDGGGGGGGGNYVATFLSQITMSVGTNGGAANSAGGAGLVTLDYTSTPPAAPTNGACGSPTLPATTAPSAGLCSAGQASIVTTSTSSYIWTCAGTGNGASTSFCSVPRSFTVTGLPASNGSVSPPGGQTVLFNNTTQFTLAPANGFQVQSVGGTCGGQLQGNIYTTLPITADCNVSVTYAPPTSGTTVSFTSAGTYSWTVPAGINSVTLSARGGGGGGGTEVGTGSVAGHGGNGGASVTTVPVTAGDIWTLVVGGGGGLGQGGAATSVTHSNTVLVIAGGGGGAGTSGLIDPANGGDGGGGAGGGGAGGTALAPVGAVGGAGGSASVGGAGGVTNPATAGIANSAPGTSGSSASGIAVVPGGAGGIGNGNNSGTGYSGGSGGSGYGGGGGGASGGSGYMGFPSDGGGGGGGGSYLAPSLSLISMSVGTSSNGGLPNTVGGDGSVSLSFAPSVNGACALQLAVLTSPPTTGLCLSGTPTNVIAGNSSYTWGCNGTGTSTAANACSAQRGYNVTASGDAHVTLTPASQVVAYNYSANLTVTTTNGFTPTFAGSCGGTRFSNSYMTSRITGNCTVIASSQGQAPSNQPQTPGSTTTTHTGSVYATLTSGTAGCTFDNSQSGSTAPPQGFNSMRFPHGGYQWRLTGCSSGETVRVSLTFPSLAGMTLLKYGPYPTPTSPSSWYTPKNLVINGNTASYDVVDNGSGDSDSALGVIFDPAFPVQSGSTAIPTLSEWGRMMVGALLVIGGLVFIRRRRMST